MDFTNRSVPTQHQEVEPVTTPGTPGINVKRSNGSNKRRDTGMWSRVGIIAAFIAIVILIIAVIVLVGANNNSTQDKTEASYIKPTKLQAVFLNTGQVYFGYIKTLNNDYVVLTDIYYLQTSSSSGSSSSTSSSNSNVTLVKLGCELHRPYDQMVINRSQVTFWENLQSDGQVAQAVAKYQAQNPNHTCTDQSSSASTSTGSAAQSASPNTGSTGSTGTTTNP